MTTDYQCGCQAVNGLIVARCAWAAMTKAQLDQWGQRDMPGIANGIVTRLATELSAHYPSRFTAPQPCGPVS